MADDWLTPAEYRRRREMAALADRRRRDEETRDPLTEQAFIAWAASGRVLAWKEFLREFIRAKG